jgi:hypothetical protein
MFPISHPEPSVFFQAVKSPVPCPEPTVVINALTNILHESVDIYEKRI